jgi:hypothetical protein
VLCECVCVQVQALKQHHQTGVMCVLALVFQRKFDGSLITQTNIVHVYRTQHTTREQRVHANRYVPVRWLQGTWTPVAANTCFFRGSGDHMSTSVVCCSLLFVCVRVCVRAQYKRVWRRQRPNTLMCTEEGEMLRYHQVRHEHKEARIMTMHMLCSICKCRATKRDVERRSDNAIQKS